MSWTVWANQFDSGELSTPTLYQLVSMNEAKVIRAVRTWVIITDDAVFNTLYMELWSAKNGTPLAKLATSDSRTKSEIITLENGVKEVWFEFDDVTLGTSIDYAFVLQGTGYVPTTDGRISWMKAFPDPVYSTGYTPLFENLPTAPYQMYFIGADF